MFVTLILLVFGVLLLDMRKRLKVAETRLASLEGDPILARHPREPQGDASQSGDPSPARSVLGELPEMDQPTPNSASPFFGNDAGERVVPPARVVARRIESVEAPPPAEKGGSSRAR
ncbi:hypothetical protein [Sphingobium sp. EP60837]|uniref:hypothetical protein n=1 Tax=Sphingobium sp. EP60837 TaxID=1855519 RepID=UPI0007DDB183|nr:hypothetical protein [Sphingobium sp. EP60837]ANI79384.1 hypothetical protein EP837_02990 [Sphingobium sp. EP60837]